MALSDERRRADASPLRVVALLNPSAGVAADQRVAAASQALADVNVDAEIITARGPEIDAALRAAADSGVDAVVVGGGDGTIRAAAAALMDSEVSLGILPLGTFNHFAKDLGIPLALEDAARTVAEGFVRRVDVASVNGAVFVNNSSIGLYPQVVLYREEQRARLGRGKWPAFALATIAALRRFPMVEVRCDVESRSFHRVTPFTFVGNNRYELNGLALGGRASLAEGRLCLHLVNRPNRLSLFRLAVRALLGRLHTEREIESVFARELSIATRRRWVHVSTDGELAVMKTPLHYRIHPRALRVIVPAIPDTPTAPLGLCAPGPDGREPRNFRNQVVPAKAGIHEGAAVVRGMDPGFRRGDKVGVNELACQAAPAEVRR